MNIKNIALFIALFGISVPLAQAQVTWTQANDTNLAVGQPVTSASIKEIRDAVKWGSSGNNVYRTVGNVGIGTTSPTVKLQIGAIDNGGDAKLRITGNSAGSAEGGEIMLNMAADHDTTYDSWSMDVYQDDLRFFVSGSERVRLKAEGNVGIGTTAPSNRLEVAGKIEADNFCDRNGANCSTPAAIAGIISGGGGGSDNLGNHIATQNLVMGSNAITGSNFNIEGANELKINDAGEGINFHDNGSIYMKDDATDDKLILNASAVGIGTTSPGAKLDINGGLLIRDRAQGIMLGDPTWDDDSVGNPYLVKGGWNGTRGDYVDFYVTGNGNEDETARLSIDNNGGIGIGTTSPTVQLQVDGGGDASLSDGSGYLMINSEDSSNLLMDNNEIMARDNGANATLYMQNEGGTLKTGGNFYTAGRTYIDNGTNYLAYPTGGNGSIQVNGGGAGGYEGYSIDGREVFMHNGSSNVGLYNDVANRWRLFWDADDMDIRHTNNERILHADQNSYTYLYNNGSWKLRTQGDGVRINNKLWVSYICDSSGGSCVAQSALGTSSGSGCAVMTACCDGTYACGCSNSSCPDFDEAAEDLWWLKSVSQRRLFEK